MRERPKWEVLVLMTCRASNLPVLNRLKLRGGKAFHGTSAEPSFNSSSGPASLRPHPWGRNPFVEDDKEGFAEPVVGLFCPENLGHLFLFSAFGGGMDYLECYPGSSCFGTGRFIRSSVGGKGARSFEFASHSRLLAEFPSSCHARKRRQEKLSRQPRS